MITILVGLIAFVAVFGGIWLLKQRKFTVNERGKIVKVEVDVPILGKLKTNIPEIAVIFLGIALAAFVHYTESQIAEKMQVTGSISVKNASKAMDVEVAVVPGDHNRHVNIPLGTTEEITFPVQKTQSDHYDAIVQTPSKIERGGVQYIIDRVSLDIDPENRTGSFSSSLQMPSGEMK